jgi:hypothetical protein
LRFVIHSLSTTWQGRARKICLIAITALTLTACGGPSLSQGNADPTATLVASPTIEAPAATLDAARTTCSDGRLLVGDLATMERRWQNGVEQAIDKATEWQDDAKLSSLRIGCELLEPGFRWQTTFYSPSSQSYFESDTGRVEAAEDDPAAVPELVTTGLSFELLRQALNAEGYDDATELDPSTGVELRPSTTTHRFGPPDAPEDSTLFHVAIRFRGEVKDLFVDAKDGKVYRYSFQ